MNKNFEFKLLSEFPGIFHDYGADPGESCMARRLVNAPRARWAGSASPRSTVPEAESLGRMDLQRNTGWFMTSFG